MRRWTTASALLVLAALLTPFAPAQLASNPILDHADPFITSQPVDGRYILLATSGNNVTLWAGPTVPTSSREAKTVFTAPAGLRELWSPTLWHMGDRWWIYFTARAAGQEHGVYALQSTGDDPLGSYSYMGMLDLGGRPAIDPSVLTVRGADYLMYVTVDQGANRIYIARLASPMQIAGAASLLAEPEYPWEKGAGSTRTYPVDEGPTALYHAGNTFVVFSASDTASPRYCLGLLTFRGGDPLLRTNWTKLAQPVFAASPEHGIWGPGRGTFATSADGSNWLLYAAKSSDAPTAQGRAVRAQRFTWNANGAPDFGVPLADGPIQPQ